MKRIIITLLTLLPLLSVSQQVVNGPNSPLFFRDTSGLGSGGAAASLPRAFIDLSKAPYNMTSGSDASLACEQAIDSLWSTYRGGTVYLPYPYNWGRPHVGSNKGVRLRPNITILGNGQRLTLTNNSAWFSTDFGSDSLGAEINGTLDTSTTNIPVVSSSGFLVGDTVFGRFGTAPYDAAEPKTFGWFRVKAIPDGTHITIDKPCGATMVVAGTVSLNRRLIRVHVLTTNVKIKNLEFYSTTAGGGYPEAGIYVQGGWNIEASEIRGTNVGSGLVNYQFGVACSLRNSYVDSCDNQSNANWGRGITLSESVGSIIDNVEFHKWRQTAINNEANNPGTIVRNCRIFNDFNDSVRIYVTSLGSGDILFENNRFGGYESKLYDQVNSFGKLILHNTTIDVGTKFSYYEQLGVYTSGYLTIGNVRMNGRKLYAKTFLMPVNSSVRIDTLPKGYILDARVSVQTTTGITESYFARDNTFTNNGTNFFAQLVTNGIVTPSIGTSFSVGAQLTSTNLNYNADKCFVLTTNSSMVADKYCTVWITYLESADLGYNNANQMAIDAPALTGTLPVINGGTGVTTSTGTGSVVLSSAPTLTNPVVGTQSTFDSTTKAASTAFFDRAAGIVVWDVTSVTTVNLYRKKYINININPAVLLASVTVVFPPAPVDGDEILISCGGTVGVGSPVVTLLTLTGSTYGTSVPSTVNGGDTFKFVYFSGGTIWKRIIL